MQAHPGLAHLRRGLDGHYCMALIRKPRSVTPAARADIERAAWTNGEEVQNFFMHLFR
jgi:hypothetical protein